MMKLIMPTNTIKNLIREETRKLTILRREECEKCGATKNLNIHHKIYRWKPKLEDIKILCVDCHTKIHRGKKDPTHILIEEELPTVNLNEKKILDFYEGIKRRLTKREQEYVAIPNLEKYTSTNRQTLYKNIKLLWLLGYIEIVARSNPMIIKFKR